MRFKRSKHARGHSVIRFYEPEACQKHRVISVRYADKLFSGSTLNTRNRLVNQKQGASNAYIVEVETARSEDRIANDLGEGGCKEAASASVVSA